MNHHQEIQSRILRLAAQAHQIATQQEAGMADTPLTSLFDQLRNATPPRAHIALVALDPDSPPRVLAALLDQDYPLCRVVVPNRVGFTEVHLQEQGFVLESDAGRQEFDQPATFLRAMEDARSGSAAPAAWSDPVRLALQAPAGRHDVTLLIPDSLASLSEKPALLSLIADRAGFLLLAGPSAAELPSDARLTLQTLLESIPGLQAVLTDPEPPAAPGAPPWIAPLKPRFTLPAHTLSDPTSPPLLPFLDPLSPANGFKLLLADQRATRLLDDALGLLEESINAELDTLASRARLLDSTAPSGSSADSDSRRVADDIKNRVQDDFEAIKKNREDFGKRAQLRGGALHDKIAHISDTLRVDDIEREPRETVVKLSLAEDKLADISQALEHDFKKFVIDDIRFLEESIAASNEEFESQLETLTGLRTRLHVEPIDRSAWWDSLVALAKPEVRYRSEMPKVTFFKRLSEARGGLSLVMMASMLLGGLQLFLSAETLKLLKTYISLGLIPVLLGGLAWTFISVKKRDRLTLEKELDRLREGVANELKKVVSELLRAQSNQIATYLGRVAKQLTAQVTDALKKVDDQSRASREDDQRRARERNRGLEQRTREKSQHKTELGRLRQSLQEIHRLLDDWIKTLAAASAPAPAVASPSPSSAPRVTPSPSRVAPSPPRVARP